MRVHIISDVYPPEPVTAAGIARDIAEEMTRRGHETTVFAPFPNRPAGKLMGGYQRSWRQVEQRDGYRIVYSWHTLSKHSLLASRTAENISFGLTSTLQLLREPVPDVVYMNTWPLFAQWMNTYVLCRRGVPVICVVKDLYPESFFNAGRISATHPVVRLAIAIDVRVYEQSALVTALNPLMAAHIITTRRVPPSQIRVVHDWVDVVHFHKNQPKNGSFRQQHNLSADLFVAMYVGSMTRMAGLELYVQAAERLRHRRDIRLLLVGDGAIREEVEATIRRQGLENIQVLYPLRPEEVPAVQAAGDVLMLSLLPGGAEHATPSKLIFYMFSQRPVLASVQADSPPAHIIREAQCGYVVRQGDPKDLAERLEQMADDRAALQQLGDKARRYAEAHFLKASVLPQMCDLIEQLGQRWHTSP